MIVPRTSDAPFAVAEWEPCRAIWCAWPHDRAFWGAHLGAAKREIAALIEALAAGGSELEVLVHELDAEKDFRSKVPDVDARIRTIPYDDIWLRDTGPVFGRTSQGLAAGCFEFNGWGGKWSFERDREVGRRMAGLAGALVNEIPLVLEGGAVEFDGEGTCLSTKEVVLNENRNPSVSVASVFDALNRAFAVEKLILIDRGLAGDHTDGHIDNLVRFVGPGRVACSVATQDNDPNAALYREIRERLDEQLDARGRALEVVEVPSPGRIVDEQGNPLPASHLNYCLADGVVVVPVFGSPYDRDAVNAIAACFPDREAVGLSASAVLHGGGAFHCMTANEPRMEAARSGT